MQGRHQRRHSMATRLSCAGLAALALLLASFAAPTHPANAAPSGSLTMNPANTSLNINDTVNVAIDVVSGANIHEVRIGITYDASVVQVVDAEPGSPGTVEILPGVFPGDNTTGSVLQNAVSGGIINYQYALNGSAEVSGSGTVATVQFKAIANGNANLAFSLKQFGDGSSGSTTPDGAVAIIVVGGPVPTATATPVPTATATTVAPTETTTSAATATAAAGTATNTATATPTPASSVTATPTRTATRTATATRVVFTSTPTAAAAAKVTILQNSNNATPTPKGGVAPARSGQRPSDLPDAGQGPGRQWWKWLFFVSALMLAGAGWFFTFAVHAGDREVILTDRRDPRRRRR
ncbi:MAG: hypothetical protein HYX50_04185 [Chloroflexi bacterium]|nr:hypothetical protein [Chloroflexota bacterium]